MQRRPPPPRRSRGVLIRGSLALLCSAALVVGWLALVRSSAFAVTRVTVAGAGDQGLSGDVVATATGAVGARSLLAIDAAAVARSLAALPGVHEASVDRAFPHELRIRVVPETPAAVVSVGQGHVVIAASGRVIGPAVGPSRLPVIDAAGVTIPPPGGNVGDRLGEQLVVASALLRFRALHVTSLLETEDGLVAQMRGGVAIRLGDGTGIDAKLTLASAVLRRDRGVDGLPVATRYVDVSVLDHPVVRLIAGDPATAVPGAPTAPADVAGAQRPVDVRAVVADLFVPTQP